MVQIFTQQQNFSGGTVTSKASGRVDIPQFNNSIKDSSNLIVTKYGSLASRPGTQYISSTVTSTTNRLITFKYADNVGYALEFGDGELRFFKNKAVVTDATEFENGTFTSDIDGWTDNSSGTGAISHSTNLMRLVGGGGGNEARATALLPKLGIKQYTITLDVATTDVTYKVGTTSGGQEISNGTVSVGTTETFNFTLTASSDIYITFEQAGSATTDIDNVALSSPEYVIDHPYSITDLQELHFTQSFDILYITHKDYAPRKLLRIGNDDWELTTISFKDGPYFDINTTTTTVTPGAVSGSGVTLTFSSTTGINNDQGFTSADVGRTIRVKSGPDTTDQVKYVGDGTRTTFPITFSYSGQADVEVYSEAATGVWTLQTYAASPSAADEYSVNSLGQCVFSHTAPASGVNIVVQRVNTGTGRWGWGTIASVTSDKIVTVDIQDSWHGTNATTDWRLGAWHTANYPNTVTFHEQRLYFGGSGRWVWGSQVGDYENFQPDDSARKGTPTAVSAVYFQIASQEGNEIQSLASQQGLGVFTTGDMTGLLTDIGGILSAVTPPSPSKNAEVSAGNIQPIVVNRGMVFTNYQKNAVNIAAFDYNAFGYVPQEISTFAENLFTTSAIKRITYQALPNKILWILREDGKLVSLTLQPELGVTAFMEHTLAGTDCVVESITSVPSGNDNDHLYLIIKRTIDSSTVRYIEVLEDFYDNDSITTNSYFVDSSLHYNSTATATITGLSHLEGEEVRVITENGIHPNRTVASGQITLDDTYEDVIVGLYSNRHVETHPLQVNLSSGSGRGSKKSLYEIHVEFYETASAKVGYNSSNLQELIFTEPSGTGTNNLELYTGLKRVNTASTYSETIQTRVEQEHPLPLTINSIISKFEVIGK